MPDGYDAVQINTSFVAPVSNTVQYGVPLIIGTAAGVASASIQYFDNLSSLLATYDATNYPAIAKCATSINNNGVRRVAVGVYKTKISELYDLINIEARTGSITSVVVAGFTLDSTTAAIINPASQASLVATCNANNLILILAATPPNGSTITPASIAALRAGVVSPNVYMVAYNDAGTTDDIGGCVTGVMESVAPQITMMWKDVVCDIDTYFTNAQLHTIETAHINGIIQDLGLSASYTTDMYVAGQNTESGIITDISITRSIYYIKRAIQSAIINLRKNAVKLGYTNMSLNLISSAITTVLEDNKSSAINTNGMIDTYSVSMPLLSDISAADKAANTLSGVVINMSLIGEIQTFSFELVVTLGGN